MGKPIQARPLNELVERYGSVLAPALADRVVPIYQFDESQTLTAPQIERLNQLGKDMPLKLWTPSGEIEWRGALPGQRHAIAALVAGFKAGTNRIIERGETGVGKTQITLMALDLLQFGGTKVFPALVLTPSRLVKQWQTRAKLMLPNVATWQINTPEDADVFASMTRLYRGKKNLIGILSMSMVSRGPGWHPVYRWVGYEGNATMGGKPQDIKPVTPFKDGRLALGCPVCYQPMINVDIPHEGRIHFFAPEQLIKLLNTGIKVHCPRCGSPLFEETRELREGSTREDRHLLYDVGEYIWRNWNRLSNKAGEPFFRTLITDEMHKMMGTASIRGETWRNLMHRARWALGLTATPYGGTASSIRMIYHSFFPKTWEEWGGFDSQRWVDELGNEAFIQKYPVSAVTNGTVNQQKIRASSQQKKELPSANFRLAAMLMPRMIHVRLEHLGIQMPPYSIGGVSCELDPDHQAAYDVMADRALAGLKGAHYGPLNSAYMQNCLTYALAPWMRRNAEVVKNVRVFPEDYVCAPERTLMKFCKDEKEAGRKTIVYVTHSDKRDLIDRIITLLKLQGMSGVRLPTSLDREDIPEWLEGTAPQSDVVILNQKAIEGVDAIHFQNAFFYEVDYSLYPVPQAAGRHWRLGQTRPCKTVFLEVPKTMLYRALALTMEKLGAASTLYGDDLDAMSSKFTTGSVLTEALKQELKGTPLPDLDSAYKRAAQVITKGMGGSNGTQSSP